MKADDLIDMQVIRYALETIANDMGHNLMRMGRTTIVKEIMDINCAVLDAHGGILSQANLCPLMLFSLPTSTVSMLEEVADFKEGDVIISNDPYSGGQHLLDMQFFSPIIYKNELIGFAANIAHQLDMGGSVPGGVAGGLKEIYQEGLRLPFVKFSRAGQEDPQIVNIIAKNIRFPEETLADMRAQAATTIWGVKRVIKLVEKYGLDRFLEITDRMKDYAEEIIRKNISKMPDGVYTGVDYLDDDGIEDRPLRVQVNVKIKNDEAYIDFKGSSKQATGNVNSPWACSQGGVYYTMIGIIDPYMIINSGTFRAINVSSEEGLITHPLLPAGVTARSQTMTKITEAMLKAMSQIVPQRVVAGSHGQACTCSFFGTDQNTDKRFGYLEIQGGGAGARYNKDGPDGQDLHLGRFMNTPIEAVELENPVMIERYEMIKDSGGAGKYRGGMALRRDIRFFSEVTWARYSDRQKFAPQGIFGGLEGSKGKLILNPDTDNEKSQKSKGVSQIMSGDLLSIQLPGSGGYGYPWERDPESVRADLKNRKISKHSAEENYLVVFNDDLTVNLEETTERRNNHGRNLN